MSRWIWVLVLGCGKGEALVEAPPSPGEVEFTWLIGPDGCDASGVVDVSVVLRGGEEPIDVLYRCDEEGGRLNGLEVGRYTLELEGLDADGVSRYAASWNDVGVDPAKTTVVPTVVLTALEAEVRTTWYFANGRMCAQNDVDVIDIGVYEDDYLVDSWVADCDLGEMALKGLRAGTYEVDLIARDRDGIARYTGDVDATMDKGDSVDVEVRLGTSE